MPRESSGFPSLLSESIVELIVELNVLLVKGKTGNKQGGQTQLKPSISWNSQSVLLWSNITTLFVAIPYSAMAGRRVEVAFWSMYQRYYHVKG